MDCSLVHDLLLVDDLAFQVFPCPDLLDECEPPERSNDDLSSSQEPDDETLPVHASCSDEHQPRSSCDDEDDESSSSAAAETDGVITQLTLDASFSFEFPVFCTSNNEPVVFILDICKTKMQELDMCTTCINNPQKCKRVAADFAKKYPGYCIHPHLPKSWGPDMRRSKQYVPWVAVFPNVSQRRDSWLVSLAFAQVWLEEHAQKALKVRKTKCHRNQMSRQPCSRTKK